MEPLKTLLDNSTGKDVLDGFPELRRLYGGELRFEDTPEGRPRVVVNYVTDADGLISYNTPGHMGGGDISMRNPQDVFVMGLLRAISQGVAVGANTVRLEPEHLWTPSFISPEHAKMYQALREKLGIKEKNPVNIFVTGSGNVLPREGALPRVFTEPDIDTMIITTKSGKKVAEEQFDGRGVKTEILAFGDGKEADLSLAFKALRERGIEMLLVEGGPQFTGSLEKAGLCDERFYTRAPHSIGNSKENPRPTSSMGDPREPGKSIQLEALSEKNWGNYFYTRYKVLGPAK